MRTMFGEFMHPYQPESIPFTPPRDLSPPGGVFFGTKQRL
jgi:hypothetical protein